MHRYTHIRTLIAKLAQMCVTYTSDEDYISKKVPHMHVTTAQPKYHQMSPAHINGQGSIRTHTSDREGPVNYMID